MRVRGVVAVSRMWRHFAATAAHTAGSGPTPAPSAGKVYPGISLSLYLPPPSLSLSPSFCCQC